MLIADTFKDLKRKNIRITTTRKKLLEIFSSSFKPLSVHELHYILSNKGIGVNKTTVYRELSFLVREGLLKQVYTDPVKIRYESSFLKHHHHLICTHCGMIDDIVMENDLKETEEKIIKTKSFKIFDHSLEFFGLCSNCN